MDVLELLRASANGGYNTIFSDAWFQYVSKQIATTVSVQATHTHTHMQTYMVTKLKCKATQQTHTYTLIVFFFVWGLVVTH